MKICHCKGDLNNIKDINIIVKNAKEKMKNIDEVKPDFILDICPFCHLQFETGQDYVNKNKSCNYDYPVIHISQLVAYCMGMEPDFIGLQYQMMGKSYEFETEPISEKEGV